MSSAASGRPRAAGARSSGVDGMEQDVNQRVPCPVCGCSPGEEVCQSYDGIVRFARVVCKRKRNRMCGWHFVAVAFVRDGMSDEEGLALARKAWDEEAHKRRYGE